MATSQTFSLSMKKKKTIIDGCIFAMTFVMERIHYEEDDVDIMELIMSRIKQQGLYYLASHHAKLYDDQIIEEFYLDASIKFSSKKIGGDVFEISATVQGIEVSVNRELLDHLFRLPSDDLEMDELETFGSETF
ncbi:hypothetical protein OROMI_016403 [Orobanche minor]